MTEIKRKKFKLFKSNPWWFGIRGWVMTIAGIIIAILCMVAPNVYMLGESFSWIPLIGVIIIIIGGLRCLDAFIAVTPQGFLLNMQGGIIDLVTGFLVLFSINDEPENLSLLVVGYLITQGIFRNVLLSVAEVQNPISNRITGVISIVMGLMIWLNIPSSAPWFLALALSIDISFRGWALIVLAFAYKKEKLNSSETSNEQAPS